MVINGCPRPWLESFFLSLIDHQIMADKPRLLKRTQLKRSVYRVLGSERGETVEGAGEEMDQSEDRRDLHLKDYDEEIFDDDDFYHQVLFVCCSVLSCTLVVN